MRITALLFTVFMLASGAIQAADKHYEVFYFYATFRCQTCVDAEKWIREVVDDIAQEKGEGKVIFTPVLKDEHEKFAQDVGANLFEVVIGEVENKSVVRHQNIGNVLPHAQSKEMMGKLLIPSLNKFDATAKEQLLANPGTRNKKRMLFGSAK